MFRFLSKTAPVISCPFPFPLRQLGLNDDRIAQVKQANDIADVVGGYLSLRPAGPTFKGLCPFHEDKHPSFDVDPRRQRYRCWSCGKVGDVISFVMEMDKISFREALEILARRAGITLQEDPGAEAKANERSQLLKASQWAHEQYRGALEDSNLGEQAWFYLEKRGLEDETIRLFGVGYAPATGTWLYDRARRAGISLDILDRLGILGHSSRDGNWYDRFRDRVMFPIRNVRSQTVGFGGRVLPGTLGEEKGPKYYNSPDSAIFFKSEELFGLDLAKNDASKSGQLVVMEGYTDVMMAHQFGIRQAVATMGTALNSRHVRTLKRFVPRVTLLYDADAGGKGGVQRALEIFAASDIDLRVATLPEGLDPCDLLVSKGPASLEKILAGAEDAIDHALKVEFDNAEQMTVQQKQQAVDRVLGVLAKVPALEGDSGALKLDLILNRMQRRLGLSETTLKNRLHLLRQTQGALEGRRQGEKFGGGSGGPEGQGDDPAGGSLMATSPLGRARTLGRPEERELLQLLLVGPELVAKVDGLIEPQEIAQPDLRKIFEACLEIHRSGRPAMADLVRQALDELALVGLVLTLQEMGEGTAPDQREAWLRGILERFAERRARPMQQKLKQQLLSTNDHDEALEILRRLKVSKSTASPASGGEPV
ncbi:MAG: DNA primase [Gemmataceae bacterium]|nr:DNA primase [Gemmataceae bacterium]